MPDFLPVAELAAKSVRDAFSAVGALVHALIPPVKVYAAADALADREAENEVDEPADTKPLSVCPCESLEDSCMWCEDAPVEPQAPSFQMPSFAWPEEASGVYLTLNGQVGGGPQRTYIPRPPETPAASATDAVVGNPPPDVPPTSGGADLTWIDIVTPAITDVLAGHVQQRGRSDGSVLFCAGVDGFAHLVCEDQQQWREHVALLIAERLEDVTLALPETSEETGQDVGGRWAAATFPQYQRPLQK